MHLSVPSWQEVDELNVGIRDTRKLKISLRSRAK